jgi:cytochrome c-type biogenesis protein CcmH
MRALLALVLLAWLALPAIAVNPDEVLPDPALEARARAISAGLRCLVCQNESIDDSDADLAHQIRVLVRDRLKAGDTDAQVVQYLVDRYGEFILLKPRFSPGNAALWLAPIVVLLVGGALFFVRVRKPLASEGALTSEEEAQVRRLVEEDQV